MTCSTAPVAGSVKMGTRSAPAPMTGAAGRKNAAVATPAPRAAVLPNSTHLIPPAGSRKSVVPHDRKPCATRQMRTACERVARPGARRTGVGQRTSWAGTAGSLVQASSSTRVRASVDNKACRCSAFRSGSATSNWRGTSVCCPAGAPRTPHATRSLMPDCPASGQGGCKFRDRVDRPCGAGVDAVTAQARDR